MRFSNSTVAYPITKLLPAAKFRYEIRNTLEFHAIRRREAQLITEAEKALPGPLKW
jgi:hypothetical protein